MSKVVVIKVGSSLVTDSNDSIDKEFIRSVSSQIRDLVEKGFEVTVVSAITSPNLLPESNLAIKYSSSGKNKPAPIMAKTQPQKGMIANSNGIEF